MIYISGFTSLLSQSTVASKRFNLIVSMPTDSALNRNEPVKSQPPQSSGQLSIVLLSKSLVFFKSFRFARQ